MTQVVKKIPDWIRYREGLHGPVGFVPTMGALHSGHVSLIERSLCENDHTVVSIFVNPTQFDQKSDLQAYPKTFDSDLMALRQAGADFLLYPEYEDLYPDHYAYRVQETELSRTLCGAHRPGHFDGVLTVVLKLLNIVRADHAYFGEKDYQQYLLVREMARAFFLPTEIVPCPTVRESDELAMSSRNVRLTPEQRKLSAEFPRILRTSETREGATERLQAKGFEVDYVEERFDRRLGAVRIGGVRLIDNVEI